MIPGPKLNGITAEFSMDGFNDSILSVKAGIKPHLAVWHSNVDNFDLLANENKQIAFLCPRKLCLDRIFQRAFVDLDFAGFRNRTGRQNHHG